MIGIYFSGTGNTKHCMQLLTSLVDPSSECLSIENDLIVDKIKDNEVIFIGYPTQFSNIPYILREFINVNKSIWVNKKVFCIATMGAFSGDGAGCCARLLKTHRATVLGGLHIKMPDSVCDSKMLKKSPTENMRIISQADEKIYKVAESITAGKYPQDGVSALSHMCGLLGQRLWFYNKTTGYTDKIKIHESCIACGTCVDACPMKNLRIVNSKVVAGDKCTMCYRCISYCPTKSITLLGKRVVEQYRFDKLGG